MVPTCPVQDRTGTTLNLQPGKAYRRGHGSPHGARARQRRSSGRSCSHVRGRGGPEPACAAPGRSVARAGPGPAPGCAVWHAGPGHKLDGSRAGPADRPDRLGPARRLTRHHSRKVRHCRTTWTARRIEHHRPSVLESPPESEADARLPGPAAAGSAGGSPGAAKTPPRRSSMATRAPRPNRPNRRATVTPRRE